MRRWLTTGSPIRRQPPVVPSALKPSVLNINSRWPRTSFHENASMRGMLKSRTNRLRGWNLHKIRGWNWAVFNPPLLRIGSDKTFLSIIDHSWPYPFLKKTASMSRYQQPWSNNNCDHLVTWADRHPPRPACEERVHLVAGVGATAGRTRVVTLVVPNGSLGWLLICDWQQMLHYIYRMVMNG